MRNLPATLCLTLVVLLFSPTEGWSLPPCPEDPSKYYDNCFGTFANSGSKYVGEWKDDNAYGQGTLTFVAGDKYVGEFRDGKFHGQGTYYSADGDKYVGEFRDDKFHGQGTYYYLADNEFKGDKYVGESRDGKWNGQGTYTFADGTVEEGIFKDDAFQYAQKTSSFALPECPGTYDKTTWTNCVGSTILPEGATPVNTGDHYQGAWINGKPEGQGVLTGKENGDFKYVGEFESGGAHGTGTFTGSDGFEYVGEWRDDRPTGQGTITYANGDRYVGEWRDGQLNGQGTYTFADGSVEEGMWENGELMASEATPGNFSLRAAGGLDAAEPIVGFVATADEICELLTHKLFSYPIEDYKLVYGGGTGRGRALQWDGTEGAALWLKQKTEGLRYNYDEVNLSGVTRKLANKNLSDCLYRLDKLNPDTYKILEQYFLIYLTAGEKCFEPSYELEQRIDDLGNITEKRIPGEKHYTQQCLTFHYGKAYVHGWSWSTFAILLVWSEGHAILKTILDSGEKQLVTRVNELRQEQTEIAEKLKRDEEKQSRLERERKEGDVSERMESQRLEEANDNIRLALDILNFTVTGDKKRRDKVIVLNSEKCIFKIGTDFGHRNIYVNNIFPDTVKFYSDQFYDELFDVWVKFYKLEFSGDERVWDDASTGSMIVADSADLERVRKAWGLLFSKACEGASPSEF